MMKKIEEDNVIELERKLEELVPYMKGNPAYEVIEWAREDITEIMSIKRKLEEQGLLEYAYNLKNATDITVYKKECIEKNILDIYRIIEKELNNWRMTDLEVKMNRRERKI